MLSLIVFVLVSANLKSLITAVTLYIPIALVVLVIREVLDCIEVEEQTKILISGILETVSFTCIAMCAMSLAEFNALALVGGMLIGAGFGLVGWAVKRYTKLSQIIVELTTYIAIGAIIGFSSFGLVFAKHMTSAILMLVGGCLLLVQKMLKTYGDKNKIVKIIASSFYILSLLIVSSSIFFY